MKPWMLMKGVVRTGPLLATRTAYEQLLFMRRFLGLRCSVDHGVVLVKARTEVVMNQYRADFDGFEHELSNSRGRTWLEVYLRQKMLESGVETLFISTDRAGLPIYAQWLVTAEQGPALYRFAPGRYPTLAADEGLVEGAFTFAPFRGLGVMADGMGQLLERAHRAGIKSVITYVAEDNLASLRGCARVGFVLDHLRVNRRRFGRRTSVMSPPDEHARSAWLAAVGER